MRQRSQISSATSRPSGSDQTTEASAGDKEIRTNDNVGSAKRSNFALLALFILVINGSVAVHYYQFDSMPNSLTAEEAGKRGFSEDVAMKHVRALTALGPHPVGSDALDRALEYVLEASENVKRTAHWEVDVEVELFNVKPGANRMVGGLFKGKSLVYSDLTHVILRISPKYASEAREKAILVSSHVDTVFSAEGAGDCSSCVAVMLELARGISHWAHGFQSSVIFLFNTGEEEGLNGAHSFITQHPWSSNIQIAIDLEAMGIGGKSIIFQAGPNPWVVENFGMVAKYPSAQIIAQDIFSSGAIKSATDFQVYKELAGLSGLDFAYMDNTAVYHTKNDKLKLYKLGSLQHLGENMLAFLLHAGASPDLAKGEAIKGDGDTPIYFDILGSYIIVFRQRFANMLYNSVIMQSLLIWATSLLMGGYPAAISLALSVLSVILMWICSISFSVIIGFIVTLLSASPVPFVSIPWLVIGLFGAPALLGAFIGQHVGYLILERYLLSTYSKTKGKLSPVTQANLAKLEAERWLFKAGLLQWLVLLMVGNYFKIGSSYIALVWLVSPAFAYGLLEATLSPARLPKPLKTLTLLVGLSVPFLISSGVFILLGNILVGTSVRFDRDPGNTPEWLGSVVLSAYVAGIVCLTLVYLLSYVHISGARKLIVFATCILLGLSLIAISSGVVPPFTEDTSRAVNVVHVVETAERSGGTLEPSSYVSLFSTTPGKLIKEVEEIGEGFVCGREKPVDFVTFLVKYGCSTNKDAKIGWNRSGIPRLLIESDTREGDRITQISVDTKASTRWTLAINTKEIEDFVLEDETEELVPPGDKSSVDGWHTIQFSGGKKSPTKFKLTLFWVKNYTQTTDSKNEKEHLLLRLRTDVDKLTPMAERVLKKLPSWCSLFGKSTSPHALAFLNNLPVVF